MREISSVHISLVVMTSWAWQSAGSARRLIARLRIDLGVECHIEEADHHLVPALLAVPDFLGRVGIVLVVHRVVVVRRTLDERALRQLERLLQQIAELPTEA